MQHLSGYREIRYSRIVVTLLLSLILLSVVFGVIHSIPTTDAEGSSGYHPADVVFDQPLEGHYVLMPAHPLSISPDLERVAPHLQLPQTSVDLGELTDNIQVENTFMVHNTGEGMLRIERIYTTCACLIAHLTASVIPSGQMALLRVELDPTQVVAANENSIGVRYGAFLESNDPYWPQASVWIEAKLSERN